MSAPIPDYGISFKTVSTNDVLLKAEQHAENFLNQQISDSNYDYQLSSAQLWAVKKDNTFYFLASLPDVYDLLSNEDYNLSSYLGVIIHTTGWAAPLEEDTTKNAPPSSHPSRRRVALAACVTNDSVGSALSFADEPDEIIMDPGSAKGTLAEALVDFWQTNSYNTKF
jgi:hypothetical protein